VLEGVCKIHLEKLEDVLPPYKKPIVIEGADKVGK
jgi:hypothetical protein